MESIFWAYLKVYLISTMTKYCIKYIFTPNIKSRSAFIKKKLYTHSNLDINIRRIFDTENMFKINAESYQDHKIYRFIDNRKDFEKNINSIEDKKKKNKQSL